MSAGRRARAATAALFLAATSLIPSSSVAAQAPTLRTVPVEPLVEVGWLLDHIDDVDVVVLHMERRSGRFEAEHIAGARPLRFDQITWEGEEGWIAEFRDTDEIVAALRAAGIDLDSRVVIYGASMTATARTWATNRWYCSTPDPTTNTRAKTAGWGTGDGRATFRAPPSCIGRS